MPIFVLCSQFLDGSHVLSLLIKLMLVVIGIYWAGDATDQNPKIKGAIALIESGYGSFNDRLKHTRIQEGLKWLRKIYGWAAITIMVAFFFLGRWVNESLGFVLSIIFFASFWGWFSIRWSTEHKKELAEFTPLIIGVLGPLLIGILDLINGTSLTNAIADLFYIPASAMELNVPRVGNPVVIGGTISAICALSLAVLYLLTWLLVVPIVFASVALIALPIWFARLIDLFTPKKPFPGFLIMIIVALTILDWAVS